MLISKSCVQLLGFTSAFDAIFDYCNGLCASVNVPNESKVFWGFNVAGDASEGADISERAGIKVRYRSTAEELVVVLVSGTSDEDKHWFNAYLQPNEDGEVSLTWDKFKAVGTGSSIDEYIKNISAIHFHVDKPGESEVTIGTLHWIAK